MFSFFETGVRLSNFCLPWRTLLLAGIAIIFYWLGGAAPETWVYDRQAVIAGEWWRLLSSHWVHSDVGHALWDIAALAVLGLVFEAELGKHFFGVLIAGMIGVSLWLLGGGIWLDYYCGLSGILNALLVAGLMRMWQTRPHPLIVLSAGLYVLKVSVELAGGDMLVTNLAWRGVPQAHIAGMLSGLLYTWATKSFFLSEKNDESIDYSPVMPVQSGGDRRRKPCTRGNTGIS